MAVFNQTIYFYAIDAAITLKNFKQLDMSKKWMLVERFQNTYAIPQ